MAKIKTYEFTYKKKLDDGWGTVQFCAPNRTEAIELFEDWQRDNGYHISKYHCEPVFEQSDKDVYGDDYFM